ncbi:hypothetical protein PHYSODRAFT_533107 [Phytophthora sojae]|uniref:Uncharacterized protein n=2 Tax=Phytophthora sojae (strain P6497) TaxID=1094619 RepID=G5AEX2_PHYSP|nr:hypothetical protein PHYSODRAFT_532826 [Phytophthora sojae]XP_009538626.1 hypothetical protein PHYSODRAFT_533107 [Phytophthora sojae]EGZ05762.1 hypothetical protein PHYSODRAFT_532826 [Phytophthora sojae]EGZ05765.1 hypothetical protein PHYSODRAFT_533107 [Phytophthora sojae]|eukprot:XP_009538623.1 hypothetical protein PHYSODRAFT_532826 [Phytophthora sojae]
MRSQTSFTTKQVCTYFFTPLLDEQDEPTEHFRCQFGTVHKQDVKTGYSNLFSHVLKQHPDYVTTLANSGFNSGTMVVFIDQKSQTAYCWLDFVTERNLPFSFCEHPTVDKYTTMKRICTETLLKYAVLVTKEVEIGISAFIPLKFGIILDGWSFHSEHYVAVFAVFEHDQRSEKVLLALAPIADDGVEDQTAESYGAFLTGILPFFKRDISSIIYLVADNCSVNTRLAGLLQVPFIGCASHRLNLAVNVYLSD